MCKYQRQFRCHLKNKEQSAGIVQTPISEVLFRGPVETCAVRKIISCVEIKSFRDMLTTRKDSRQTFNCNIKMGLCFSQCFCEQTPRKVS